MRGKRPKERDKYLIRLGDGTLVEVNREIYLEWYRSERRERYQKERDRKYGVCSLEGLEEKGHLSQRDVCVGDVTQEAALRNIWWDRLRQTLEKLPEQEARLIVLLYFEKVTLKKAAEIFRCSRKSIESRRQRILKEMCRTMVTDI